MKSNKDYALQALKETRIYIFTAILCIIGAMITHTRDDLWFFLFGFSATILFSLFISKIRHKYLELKGEDVATKNFQEGTFGAAKWATKKNIEEAGMNTAKGIALSDKVYYPRYEGHVLTCGTTRTGKGNLVMLNLLQDSYDGSIVVFDPKGEIASVTYEYQKSLGKQVHLIDPWNYVKQITGNSNFEPSKFNPLDVLNPDHESLSGDCESLAELLIPKNHKKEDHWSLSARNWIASLLYYQKTVLPKNQQTIRFLAKLLRLPVAPLIEGEDSFGNHLSLMKTVTGPHAEINEENANEMLGMLQGEDREGKSILSTARSVTSIFRSPMLSEALSTSDFDIRDLTKGNMVLYICLPSDKLSEYSLYLRLIVGSLMKCIQRHSDKNVLMILDEFYSLGYLSEIAKNMGQMASYHLQLWPIIQDFNQLKDLYDQGWETFIANAPCRIITGIEDQTSAEYISKQLGTFSKGTHNIFGEILEEKKRDLLNPLEVRSHSENIVFTRDTPPISLDKIRYWEHPEYSERAAKNPYIT